VAEREPDFFDAAGIGVAVRDLTVLLDTFPSPDSKTRAREFAETGGGPVPTALVTLARLGRRTAFIGVVGDDEAGRFILEDLRREGVDTSACVVRAGHRSPTSVILVERDGRRTVCEWGQVSLPLKREDMHRAAPILDRCRFLLVDARLPGIQIEAARRARKTGARVVLDCGHPRPGVTDLLRECDVTFLSHSFPRAVHGEGFAAEDCLHEVSLLLPAQGLRIAGLTLGADGCIVAAEGSTPVRIPGVKVACVDTTGAGDVFHGAIVHALLRGMDHVDAARFANAAAALKCRGLTGRAPLPPEDEIDRVARTGAA